MKPFLNFIFKIFNSYTGFIFHQDYQGFLLNLIPLEEWSQVLRGLNNLEEQTDYLELCILTCWAAQWCLPLEGTANRKRDVSGIGSNENWRQGTVLFEDSLLKSS